MACRSHNETFILLRNNAQKNRSFYRDFNKDDERVKLVGDNGDDDEEIYDMELTNNKILVGQNVELVHDVAFPSWISSLDEFRYESFYIRDKIEQLKKTQLEHLKQQSTAIFADDVANEKLKDYEMEIDRRCQDLNVLFNRLHSIVMHFKTLKSYGQMNGNLKQTQTQARMVSNILKNIFQYQVQEVVALTQLFRSCQRVYFERRNEATKVDPEFVITFDSDLLEKELNSDNRFVKTSFEDDTVFFANNNDNHNQMQQQKQLQISLNDQIKIDQSINDHLYEREREMNSIMKSFVELNQLFQEVQTLVIDQGSALDRIDYNIEQVEHKVELGAVSLEKAHRSISRVRKLKLILGAGLFLFLLFIFLIIRS